MPIVTSKEIAQVIGLEKFGFLGTLVGWLLMRVLRISSINKIYNKNNKYCNWVSYSKSNCTNTCNKEDKP